MTKVAAVLHYYDKQKTIIFLEDNLFYKLWKERDATDESTDSGWFQKQ